MRVGGYVRVRVWNLWVCECVGGCGCGCGRVSACMRVYARACTFILLQPARADRKRKDDTRDLGPAREESATEILLKWGGGREEEEDEDPRVFYYHKHTRRKPGLHMHVN